MLVWKIYSLQGLTSKLVARGRHTNKLYYFIYLDDMFFHQEDTLEETGWKLVHGDVFRPPRYKKLFVALIGAGIQVFCMAFITISEY